MFFLWPFKLAFKIVELLVGAVVVYFVVTAVQVALAAPGPTPPALHAKAIVVLGAPTPLPGGTTTKPAPDAGFSARLAVAHALEHAGVAPSVLVPVGKLPLGLGTVDGFLAQYGVPGMTGLAALANNAAAQLHAAGLSLGAIPGSKAPVPVVVVTDAIDAMWTERAASDDGLAATVVPPAGFSPSIKDLGSWMREASAVAAGRIIGFGRVTWA